MMNILNKEVKTVFFNLNSKASISMEKQKIINLDEELNCLDKLQVSERSDDASGIDILHQKGANIYIQPR